MTQPAAIVACVILAALAVFQAFLAAGAPIGRFAWGGRHDVLPRRLKVGSFVSIVLYAIFVLIILERAGLSALLPGAVSAVGIWILAVYFTLGIVMNAISRSVPERNLMTPVVLVLAAACWLLVFAA